LWSVPSGFAPSLLVLNWADMLLKSVPTRDALADVLNYYQNIGWIGDPARDQLLAYADGLAFAPQGAEGRDWRANAELHEKSLLYVEKLRALSGGRGGD
ncbi:MAG TPA: FlaD/FlaE family flagellar protein, partial [Candidatus Thermoplasmatota archaeon]|nr:FlaD/FlaE family flagellar protein [Candidatus Thermoplasmatota archaeon]